MTAYRLQVIMIIAVVFLWILLFSLITKRELLLKYTLIWLMSLLILTVLVIWPDLLTIIAKWLGFELGSNALYTFALFLLAMIVGSLTIIVSRQYERNRQLSQCVARMEKRIRQLEVMVCGEEGAKED